MNPELTRILKQFADATENVGTVAWDQAPLVHQDMLTSGLITSGIWMVVALAALYPGTLIRRYGRKAKGEDGEGLCAFGWMITLIPLAIAAYSANTALTIWLAP